MVHHLPVLLQHDIVDHVLSYCAAPYAENPLAMLDDGFHWGFIPRQSRWFATAAQTCKTWLHPALRHLYRTVHLCTSGPNSILDVPFDRFERAGHLVRTLLITVANADEIQLRQNYFKLFTNLTTLMFIDWPPRGHLNSLMRDIRACPSLPNLANLALCSDHPDRRVLLDLLDICKNLRGLRLDGDWDTTSDSSLLPPSRLEELVIQNNDLGLALLRPSLAATTLVTLN
jgi:hypothetical protein